MTRLKTEWISQIEETAILWDQKLRQNTGMGYPEIAAAVSEYSTEELKERAKETSVAVVPITCGLGTIDTFSESIAAIVRAMGVRAFVTEASDVDGIYEACVRGADILYMADEDRYMALNLRTGKAGDNNLATARGFAEILFQMAGNLKGERAAVLGYGIIGQLMAQSLVEKGAKITVYDRNPEKAQMVLSDGYEWMESPDNLKQYRYVADVTCEGAWLDSSMLHEEVCLASPGVPFSLTGEACEKLEGQYIHDMLEIGTAAMFGMAL